MLKHILSQNAFWVVNKQIAKHVGNDAAILLSFLIGKQDYYQTRNELVYSTKLNKNVFYAKAEDIQEETNISYKQQKGCLEKLEAFGLISQVLMTTPAKLHFCVNEKSCMELLEIQVLTKGKNLNRQNVETLINNDNKKQDKENIYIQSENFEKENSNGALDSKNSKSKKKEKVVSLNTQKSTKPMKDGLHFSKKTNNETNTSENQSQETAKPFFIQENQEKVIKVKEGEVPKAPKYENLIDLPTDKRTTRLRSAFKKMGLENGYLANSGTPLNDKFIATWEKYINEIFDKGTDLKDDFHVINFFPNWFKGESATYKPKTQKATSYNGQYQQNPTVKVLETKKSKAKQGTFRVPKPIPEIQSTEKPLNPFEMFGNKTETESVPTQKTVINAQAINNYLMELVRKEFGTDIQCMLKGAYWLESLGLQVSMQGKEIVFKIEKVSNLHYELIEKMQNELGSFSYQIH